MDLLIDILLDAGKDTLSLVPFLLVTYLALETLEHVAGDRVNGAIKRAGAAGPVVGSLLGMVPQCGFSAMAATLYAGRVVTLGDLGGGVSLDLRPRCCRCCSPSRYPCRPWRCCSPRRR